MRCIAFLLFVLWSAPPAAGEIAAKITLQDPERHFLHVTLSLKGIRTRPLELVMPSWIPGSYKIRDFARNVEALTVTDRRGQPIPFEKVEKNRWRILGPDGPGEVIVSFEVFAYELSVRDSYFDDQRAFINPSSVIPYVEGHLADPIQVELAIPDGWKVDTALTPRGRKHRYLAANYDELVDSPIEVGTQRQYDFQLGDTEFRFVVSGDGNMREAEMAKAIEGIVRTTGEMFGGFPFPRYLFLTALSSRGGGGLEHKNCCALMTSGFRFDSKAGWRGFLGLVAHEFFHAWNVKRIRDEVLGPFDYTRETYTRLLWVHEGWTDYYADLILRRAGVTSAQDLLQSFERKLNGYLKRPGRRVQSLAQASFDSWIKFYQTNQTSRNSTVNYYSHGAITGWCLELILRHHSGNEKGLDDVMRALDVGYAKQDRGITQEVLRDLLVEWGGQEAQDFLERHVYGTEDIDFAPILAYAGIQVEYKTVPERNEKVESKPGEAANGDDHAEPKKKPPYERDPLPDLGFTTSTRGDSLVVASIARGGTAWEAGLDLGDEFLALGELRITSGNWQKLLQERLSEDSVEILINRRGRLLTRTIPLDGAARQLSLTKMKKAEELAARIYESVFREPLIPAPPVKAEPEK